MADLVIRITADAEQAKRDLAQVDKQLDDIGTSGTEAGKGTDNLMKSLLKVEGVKESLRQIEQGLKQIGQFSGKSVEAFGAQELAIKKLTTALEAQGQATPAVIGQYQQLADTFQNTTQFSDDLITEMQALLVQVGNVMPQDMEKALRASTDLAAGLGVDLRTATMLVGKAFEGETGTLKRYGIVVDDAALKTDGASAVLDAITKKFGGQAQGQLDTYTGKVAFLSNKMDDFRESVGAMIASALTPLLNLFQRMPQPAQTLTLAIGTITAVVAPLATGIFGLIAALGGWSTATGYLVTATTTVTGTLTTFWGFLTGTLTPALGAIGIALGTVLAFFPPLQLAIDAVVNVWRHWDQIGPIVQRTYEGVKLWMVDKFNAVVASIQQKVDAVVGFFQGMYDKVVGHSYVPDMIRGIASEFSKLDAVMVSPSRMATTAVGKVFNDLTDRLANLVGGKNSIWGKLLSSGLGEVFGGPLMSLVSAGVGKLVDLAWEGAKKIGSFFKGLFGGGEEGTTVNPARDAWFDAHGGSVQSVGELLAFKGVDGETARQMIERVFQSKTMKDFMESAGAIDKILGRAHQGGLILSHAIQRLHSGGLMPDERLVIGQTGEGVLNRRAMAAMGPTEFHARNRGETPSGGPSVNVTIHVDGYIDSPQAQRRLTNLVSDGIMRQIKDQHRVMH